jgi:hypothetical protein
MTVCSIATLVNLSPSVGGSRILLVHDWSPIAHETETGHRQMKTGR